MTGAPVPPITVAEGTDPEVYATVAEACRAVEVYDVRDGVYAAYDCHGRVLEFDTEGYEVTGLRLAPGRTPAPEELAVLLRRSIRAIGPDQVGLPDHETASLDRLLEALQDHERRWREERRTRRRFRCRRRSAEPRV